MNTELKTEVVEHSPQADVYFTHFKALEPLNTIEVGKSIPLNKSGLERTFLDKMLTAMSTGAKKFAIIEHAAVFELFRLPDGFPTEIFGTTKPGKTDTVSSADQDLKTAMLETIQGLRELPLEKAMKYCVGIPDIVLSLNYVPLAYLQRRLSNISCFRRYPAGSTAAIHYTLKLLQEEGYLEPVSKKHLSQNYGTTAKCFKTLKNVEV